MCALWARGDAFCHTVAVTLVAGLWDCIKRVSLHGQLLSSIPPPTRDTSFQPSVPSDASFAHPLA